jgi:hypothetical protein
MKDENALEYAHEKMILKKQKEIQRIHRFSSSSPIFPPAVPFLPPAVPFATGYSRDS